MVNGLSVAFSFVGFIILSKGYLVMKYVNRWPLITKFTDINLIELEEK